MNKQQIKQTNKYERRFNLKPFRSQQKYTNVLKNICSLWKPVAFALKLKLKLSATHD